MPIDSHLSYLDKHAFCPAQITRPVQPHLGMVVVIPCHDEPAVMATLASLRASAASACAVEVLVVISGSESDAADIRQRNLACFEAVEDWAARNSLPQLQFHALHIPDLPRKHAGVGLTRKIGMDEGLRRLAAADATRGILISLDADTTCAPNYLQAIESYFEQHRQIQTCSIDYALRLPDNCDATMAAAALRIELAERILVAALRKAGHPYAFQTLGAAMAVRVEGYQAQMGMNRRKSGEDFDFLQKFIELGQHGDCLTTQVYPSARISQRKPAGVGQRVANYCAAPTPAFPVFALGSFQALAAVLPGVKSWYQMDLPQLEQALTEMPAGLRAFFESQAFCKQILEIQRYTTHESAFEKRFFRWFNSLKTFQFLQYWREHCEENAPIVEVGNAVLAWCWGDAQQDLDLEALLAAFRNMPLVK